MIKNRNIRRKKNGYVILEIVVSLGLFFLILNESLGIIFLLGKANKNLIRRKNVFDDVRAAHYFFVEQMQKAYAYDDNKKIRIFLDEERSLKKISFVVFENNKFEDREFIFEKDKNLGKAKLCFGGKGNKLAEKISDIKINYDEEKKLLGLKLIAEKFDGIEFDIDLYLGDKKIEIE